MKTITFLSVICCFTINAFPQILIDDSQTIYQIMSKLEGDGVEIKNVIMSCPTKEGKSPVGYFEDPLGILNMSKGLLMTNGSARHAIGPNDNAGGQQFIFFTQANDLDLEQLIPSNQILYDLCTIEFDVTVYSDILTFNYIFASEEYPEFHYYNDVFGFFVSGPGITGVKNIAVLPGTTIPVSVSNVNSNNNETYYVSNGTGSTPFDNPDIQYDGYTTKLQAISEVIPCETYHIKLAIADVDDGLVDSGVFIEEFNSKNAPKIRVEYEHERFPYTIEGCNDATIIFEREEAISKDITYDLTITGSATPGIDYTTIPDSITFLAGEKSTSISFSPILDMVDDHPENVTITIENICIGGPTLDEFTIDIREYFDYELEDQKKCGDNVLTLNTTPIATDSMIWQSSPFLSCLNCLSPSTTVLSNHTFNFEVWDLISGCKSIDSANINFIDIKSDFEFEWDECKTSVDVFFNNTSKSATQYLWDFGDGENSAEINPSHIFKDAINKKGEQEFTISMIAVDQSSSCADTASKVITILDPFYIPNIISPNNDLMNDVFKINGITEECWQLQVYNRWSKLVYSEKPISNQFSPVDLSDGTYYYILKNDSGDRKFNGYFQLNK